MIYLLKEDTDCTTRSLAKPLSYVLTEEEAKKWVKLCPPNTYRTYEIIMEYSV